MLLSILLFNFTELNYFPDLWIDLKSTILFTRVILYTHIINFLLISAGSAAVWESYSFTLSKNYPLLLHQLSYTKCLATTIKVYGRKLGRTSNYERQTSILTQDYSVSRNISTKSLLQFMWYLYFRCHVGTTCFSTFLRSPIIYPIRLSCFIYLNHCLCHFARCSCSLASLFLYLFGCFSLHYSW